MAHLAHAGSLAPPVGSLLENASVEVSARDPAIAQRLGEWFDPGATVSINFLPGSDYRQITATAAALRRAGFVPLPHITARHFASLAELKDTLARLVGDAGVDAVLAIGGDIAVPRGPFASTHDMLATGAIAQSGIKRIGFGAYPEGHQTLSTEVVRSALTAKLSAARAQGLESFLVTQFCFEAAPILQLLRETRAAGAIVPVRIGIAGPASVRSLLTFAMKCGIGTSLRMLINQPQSIGRMLRDATPDVLIADLAEGLRNLRAAGVGVHLFPFGGVAKTGAWRRAAMIG